MWHSYSRDETDTDTLLERSCVRVLAVAFRTSSHRSCTSHARFGVDVTREKKTAKRRRTTKSEQEKKGALRGKLSRRISLGVCPPGRGERAVTERDGVTKEGTRMRWNGTYTFFFLPHRCLRKRGRTVTVPMETRKRLPPKILGPSTSTRSLSCSLCHPFLIFLLSRALTFPRSTFLFPFRPLSIPLSVFVFIISHSIL